MGRQSKKRKGKVSVSGGKRLSVPVESTISSAVDDLRHEINRKRALPDPPSHDDIGHRTKRARDTSSIPGYASTHRSASLQVTPSFSGCGTLARSQTAPAQPINSSPSDQPAHQTAAARRHGAPLPPTSGTVINVCAEKEYGFAKILGGHGATDVHFHFSRVVRAGGLPLAQGDTVELHISERRDRLRADRVAAVHLKDRSDSSWEQFLAAVDLNKGATALTLASSPPFWTLLARRPCGVEPGGALLSQLCCAFVSGTHSRSALLELLDSAAELIDRIQLRAHLIPILRGIAAAAPARLARLLHRHRAAFAADSESVSLLLELVHSASVACAPREVHLHHLSWQQFPLLPTTRELLSPQHSPPPSLPVARRTGAYDSTEDLLDRIFALEREDCTRPLRDAVRAFLSGQSPASMDATIHHAHFEGVVVSGALGFGGACIAVRFGPFCCAEPSPDARPPHRHTQTDHQQPSRMPMRGSLLCFLLDGRAAAPVLATAVCCRGATLVVELCGEPREARGGNVAESLAAMCAAKELIAVESPVYFRAYDPVMRALQRMEELAFTEEVVRCAGPPPGSRAALEYLGVDPPAESAHAVLGLACAPGATLTGLRDALLDEAQAPRLGDLELDPSQRRAVLHALEHRVALIQGPPGTGKSLIGTVLAKLLLALGAQRVLVVTYKNRILNEVLSALLGDEHAVVRVGGSRNLENEALGRRHLQALVRSGGMGRDEALVARERQVDAQVRAAVKQLRQAADEALSPLTFTTDTVVRCSGRGQLEGFLLGPPPGTRDRRDLLDMLCWHANGVGTAEFLCGEGRAEDTEQKHLADLRDAARREVTSALKYWFPRRVLDLLEEAVERTRRLLGNSARERLSSMARGLEADGEDASLEGDQKEADAPGEGRQCEATPEECKELKEALRCPRRQTVKDGWTGTQAALEQVDEQSAAALLTQQDVWGLSLEDRALLVYAMLGVQCRRAHRALVEAHASYQTAMQEKQRVREAVHLQVLNRCKVVGMTLDGHSINAELVDRWKPQVVLVEESAECPVSKVIACLRPSLMHLIQIGDPKQLPPLVNSHHSTAHNLSVSVMERLMNSGLPCQTLQRQSRMLPEMRSLMADIYPELQDNAEVTARLQPPDCLQKAVFWWTHRHPQENLGSTYVNRMEARMAAALALYLLAQGISASQITVLAAYSGQVRELRRHLRRRPDFEEDEEIAVRTIDEFQGNENDFVVVSLVRTGALRGFLAGAQGKQRRCVAQSRARRGLYFVADPRSFAPCPEWSFLVQSLAKRSALEDGLPLICPRHPDCTLAAFEAKEIPIEKALCGQACPEVMGCNIDGHRCPRGCHGGDWNRLHAASKCRRWVPYTCPQEPAHAHKRRCCDPEAVCNERVRFECAHPERHALERLCSQAESEVRCKVLVSPMCDFGHPQASVECWKLRCEHEVEAPACRASCKRKLPCGHPCPKRCGEPCLSASECAVCVERGRVEEERAKEAAAMAYKDEIVRLKHELVELNTKDVTEMPCRTKILGTGETAAEYFEVRDKVVQFLGARDNTFPEVTRVDRVTHLGQQRRYYQAALGCADPTITAVKLHCCTEIDAQRILRQGFEVPKRLTRKMTTSMPYGCGVYFVSGLAKSAQELHAEGASVLLVCEVLLGRCMSVSCADEARECTDMEMLNTRGFDSLFVQRDAEAAEKGATAFDQYVVHDACQVLVKYVVHFEPRSVDVVSVSKQLATGGDALTRHTLLPKREYDKADALDISHFRVVESQFLRLLHHNRRSSPSTLMLKKVELIINVELVSRFEKKKTELRSADRSANEVLAFHGTRDPADIENIVQNNFDPACIRRTAFGRGFYFSEFPETSLQYGQNLLLCRVLPGCAFDINNQNPLDTKGEIMSGYDSHRVNHNERGHASQLVINNPDQILPCYVLHVGRA
ncbi:hypothetical protein CYMTET_14615 [Cymbomonas tetramitiformis]|uniref:PARP n=1 Tax=Cymbomonas tetramitiformis TaxID=36881 RepID=A0AAE0L9R3_9CHLO|nr:hypothetical protein CYMTET_14615 [Cymbomonas tetramitiformis]